MGARLVSMAILSHRAGIAAVEAERFSRL